VGGWDAISSSLSAAGHVVIGLGESVLAGVATFRGRTSVPSVPQSTSRVEIDATGSADVTTVEPSGPFSE